MSEGGHFYGLLVKLSSMMPGPNRAGELALLVPGSLGFEVQGFGVKEEV